MKKLIARLLALTPRQLTVAACYSALVGLLFMVLLLTVPSPLVLVVGMGVAHGFGLLGVLLFGGAVFLEAINSAKKSDQRTKSSAPSKPPTS